MDPINVAILGFLLNADKHGYEIFKEISDSAGFGVIYTMKIGRLYALLNGLEDENLVISSIHTEGARPPKKIYRITDAGRGTFTNWMVKPVKHGRELRINLLIKFYFAEINDIFLEDEIIDNQIRECNHWLESMVQDVESEPEKADFRYLVDQFRKSQIEGYINWLHWCKRRFLDG